MATRVIFIKGVDPDGLLVLSDRGHTKAQRGDTILWQIDQHSGVGSILSIEEKKYSTNIFSRGPYQQGRNWKGEISGDANDCDIFLYSILWKGEEKDEVNKHDPIISIKPSRFSPFIALIAFISGLFGIFYFLNLHKEKNRRGW